MTNTITSILLLLVVAHAAVAETITGLVVDRYCWFDNNGIALDTREDLTKFPTKHTVHCLVEVGICKNSGFIIVDKDNATDSTYKVLHTFDDAANDKIVQLLEQVPVGERYRETGYQVSITGSMDGGVFVGDAESIVGSVPDDNGSASRGFAPMWGFVAVLLHVLLL